VILYHFVVVGLFENLMLSKLNLMKEFENGFACKYGWYYRIVACKTNLK